MDGILLVDKPAGPTSHDIVQRVRRILGEDRIGHAGTLDPPATGLLVMAVGKATKILSFMEEHDKSYDFTIRFGRVTDTDDATGAVLRETDTSGLTRASVAAELDRFRGEIEQVPPRYSSIKVGGQRLHKLARQGKEVVPPTRRVRIHALDLVEWRSPLAEFRMSCSKGTYVRAIARDLGASVERLRRTASGPFRIGDAVAADASRSSMEEAMLPSDAGLLHLGEARLSTEEARAFGYGQPVPSSMPEGFVRVYVGPRFAGVGATDGNQLRPRKVLA